MRRVAPNRFQAGSRCVRGLLLGFACILLSAAASAQTAQGPAPPAIRLEPLNASLIQPVHVTHAPGDPVHLYIVEQRGVVRVYDLEADALLDHFFLDLRSQVSTGFERGLLSIVFHPDFPENGYFYVNFTDRGGNTQVVRYTASPNRLQADPRSAKRILQAQQPAANHNGGAMAFGPDGYLYIAMGDGGAAGDPWNNAQNPMSLLGKLLRIDVDGGDPYAIPETNPFAGHSGVAAEIWALGLRNPWRFSFDRLTGDLYIADVGQSAWEEIHFQPAASPGGENYGWNRMEGAHCYPPGRRCDAEAYVYPVAEYPNRRDVGCSITGGHVYRGSAVPELQGFYLFSDWCTGSIWAMSTAPAAAYAPHQLGPVEMWPYELILETPYQITSFGEDLAGELYVTHHGTQRQGGRVFKITRQ